MSDRWTELALDVAESIRIAAQIDDDGRYWYAGTMPSGRRFVPKRSPTIWGGTCGIALFFFDVYEVTNDTRYLDDAIEALIWCSRRAERGLDDGSDAGFLTGGLGVAYGLCRASDVTGSGDFLRDAIHLARHVVARDESWRRCDFLGGVAGGVLGLAHIEARVSSEEITTMRFGLLRALIERARPHAKGLFWDVTSDEVMPLCGMAHGGSGIAFVLMELAKSSGLPRNHPIMGIVGACFAYEDQFFSKTEENWPDFRKPGPRREYPNAWCHGAAGIGLARLSGPCCGFTRQAEMLESVARRTERDLVAGLSGERTWLSLTLCHGYGGLVEFLRCYNRARFGNILDLFGDACRRQLEEIRGVLPGYRAPDYEDHSLFLGSAGVGALLLRMGNPQVGPSALRPSLPASSLLAPPEKDWVTDALEAAIFPRTRQVVVGEGRSQPIIEGGDRDGHVDLATIRAAATSGFEGWERRAKRRAQDLLNLEWAHVTATKKVVDFRQLCRGWHEAAPESTRELPDSTRLMVRPGIRIAATRWKWSEAVDVAWVRNLKTEAHDYYHVVIAPGPERCLESWLTPPSAAVLLFLEIPREVREVISSLKDVGHEHAIRTILSLGLKTGLLDRVR